MPTKRKIRDLLLSFAPTRELMFFIFQKKVYKKLADKKIATLLKGKRKLSERKIDNLIVSLTSFPQRISEIKYVIYSLLDQTILPEKIILWLAESQFPNKERDLPQDLLALRKFGFTVEWCEDLRSYKKLIPALEQFPDYYIATADDDLYYKKDWLEKLWLWHLEFTQDVVCHLGEEIRFNNKEVLPYSQWTKYLKKAEVGYRILVCGCGGGLWHKKYLHRDINNRELFRKLAPHADDLWFYFMALLNSTKIRVVEKPHNKVRYLDPYREYGLRDGSTLASINVDGGLNDEQLKNIINHYNIDLYAFVSRENYSKVI